MADPGHAHKYQLMVTAYLASLLSKNKSVKHYYIFYEVKELEPFGDVVLAVKYSASKDFCLYLIEVKSGKIIPEVNNYLDGYSKIMQNKKWTFLEDFCNINAENIQFWYFACEKFTKPGQITFEEDSKIKNLELKELECDPDESIIDEMYNQNYKLCLQSNNIPTKHQGFFDDFYIYLQQLNEEEIVRKLGRMWKLSNPEEVINYLEQYLIKNNNCLNKTAFEHELLRIRLSNYIITPIKAIPVTKGQAYAWINLTLPYHVTIIKNTSHTKPCLFGCILAKIEDVITVDEWNRCIDNEGKLSEDVKTKISSKKFKPRTLRDLVIHFWMSNKIPLILQADDDLPALKEFSNLNQHYIIIDSKLKKRYDEMKSYNLSVIKDLGGLQVDELLQSISVSMQGKKPTSLYEVINNDNSLLETLTCSDILKLIEPKRVYLKDECFKDGRDMLFIIETEITEEYEKTIKDNILKYCPRNQGDVYYQKAVQDPKFKDYKIYRLYTHTENGKEKFSLTNEYKSSELQLIEGRNIVENNSTEEYRGLEYFFVDQHGNNVYRENKGEVVPIIGEMVKTSCPRCLTRRMRKITTTHGKVNERIEEPFSENVFFIKTARKICVIKGVPGIGKSTLLRSLARISDPEYYVLFYDLAEYQKDLSDESKKLSQFCKDPLNFLCNNHNSLPYNKFLSKLKEDRKRLIIILDSLDEIVATCEKNVLQVIKKLNGDPCLNKIIIGSRPLTVDLLSKEFVVDLVEIDGLNNKWNRDYLQNWNINESYLETMPAAFLKNPLYLNFLRIIAASDRNMENLSRWSLYETILDLNIDRFYERRNENPSKDEKNDLFKYCYALAFQAFLPGHKITKTLSGNIEEKYTNFLRISIIKRFNKNGMPVFVHRTFLGFLISRWLLKTSDKDTKYIYEYILRNNMYDILYIYSEQFRLHKAVIDEDVTQVQNLCEKNPELLKEIDGLGRTALHIAAMPSLKIVDTANIIRIMDITFQNTLKQNFNLYPCDKLLNWTWVDYFDTLINSYVRSIVLRNLSTAVLEAYWYYQYRIKNKSDWTFKDDFQFDQFCSQAFKIPSINIFKNLFLLKYYNSKGLIQVDKLFSRSEITVVALPKISVPEFGTTLMHLGCIYSNLNIVSACIERGDDVNARDRFGCTPLYYGVCSQRSEIVGLLLEKGADMKLNPTKKDFITIFEMSLRIQNENIFMMLIEAMDKSFEGWMCSTPLHDAVLDGKMQVVEMILRSGVNMNSQDAYGDTPLHCAVRSENEGLVQLLTQYHANLNMTNKRGRTPLFDALWTKNTHIMEMLLNLGADVNIADEDGDTLLQAAVRYHFSQNLIQLLLPYGTDVNLTNRQGRTPLFAAIADGNIQIINILLKAGINVNIQDVNGDTSLHIAVNRSCGSKSILFVGVLNVPEAVIKMLLEANANVNIANKSGDTPLHKAVSDEREDAVRLLVEHPATVCTTNCQQETPLLLAVVTGEIEIINILLDKKVNLNMLEDDAASLNLAETNDNISCKYKMYVNMESRSGDTALCCAIKKENVQIVNILLENGADVNYVDKNGCHLTPLFVAVKTQNVEIVEILLRKGAEVNFQSEYDVTPLYVAVLTGNLNMVKLLLEYKPNLNIVTSIDASFAKAKQRVGEQSATNYHQETPLPLAVVKEQIEIINISLNKEVNLNTLENDTALLNLPQTSDNISCKYKMFVNMGSRSGDTPLCCAIKKENVEIVNTLLENGANVNYEDKNGRHLTPLFVAVETQNVEIVEILLRKNAKVNFTSEFGVTPLYIAVLTGNLNMIKLLLEYKPNLDSVTSIETSFAKAKQRGDINSVLRLLNCWAKGSTNSLHDVTFTNDVKEFIHTVKEGSDINLDEICLDRNGNNTELVDALLKVAADVTNPTPIGIKCLAAVLELNDKEVDRILLRNFSHKYSKKVKWYTDVGYAALKGNRVMVKILWRNKQPTDNSFLLRVIACSRRKSPVEILLENQIDLNLPDEDGDTPLMTALKYRRSDVVKILLENGAAVNGTNTWVTPLSIAISKNQSELVRMLLQKGANIKIRTGSVLLDAVQSKSKSIICMLLEYGADPNDRDAHGYASLHYAVEKGRKNIIEKLLEFKADVNITDDDGLSPLDYAIRRRKYDIISIFKRREEGADNFGDSNDEDSNSESDSNDEDSNSESDSNDEDSSSNSDTDYEYISSKSASNDEDSNSSSSSDYEDIYLF